MSFTSDANVHSNGELASKIEAEQDTGGSLLSSAITGTFSQQFGHSLPPVRIHQGRRVDQLADQLDANAFTTGNSLFFRRGTFQPDTLPGRRRLAHELTHVVQQQRAPRQPGVLPVQRELRFDSRAAEAQAKIVGGGAPDRDSPTLFNTFVAGLQNYLGLTYEIVPDSYQIKSVSDASNAGALKEKIAATYGESGLELRGPLGGFTKITATKGKAVWEELRQMVRDQINDGVEIRFDKTIDGPAVEDDGVILVRPDAVSEIYFRADSKWDMFWILLHEMLHIEGLDDPKDYSQGNANYAGYKKEERTLTTYGKTETKKITMLGDVVHKLNIIRAGLELPVRTNYSDPSPSEPSQSAILFADSPGKNQVEYVGGMAMSPAADSEHNKMLRYDIYLPKTAKETKEQRHRRQGREHGKQFAPGFKVKKFSFENGDEHYTPPFAISIDVTPEGEVTLIGDYIYTHKGQERRGVLSVGEFVYDGHHFGLTFAWQEWATGASNWQRWGSAKLTLGVTSGEYDDLRRRRDSAELEGEWVSEDGDKLSGNHMSLWIERLTLPGED